MKRFLLFLFALIAIVAVQASDVGFKQSDQLKTEITMPVFDNQDISFDVQITDVFADAPPLVGFMYRQIKTHPVELLNLNTYSFIDYQRQISYSNQNNISHTKINKSLNPVYNQKYKYSYLQLE